jgi:hemoglobin/transferrin/lactoferrin receptor protein
MKGIFLLCLFWLCGVTAAQVQEQKDTTRILGEVVIAVNRWEQSISEIPHHVTKVSASLIQFQNPQTAADLLSISNQVFIQKSQLGGGSPMIRGFATNRVLLVVDGVRMNNAIFRSGNVQNVISLDANVIENAEVIFGPGSVIYGSDAIGGVMDFHTLRPRLALDEKPVININTLLRYSSANAEKTGHADVNLGLKKWAFLSSMTWSGYENLRQGSRGPNEYLRPHYVIQENGLDIVTGNPDSRVQLPSGYTQFNGLQKVRFKPNSTWDIRYAYHYSKTSRYDRYDRLILEDTDGNLNSAEWFYGPQKWEMHSLQANYLKPTTVFDVARLTAGYQDYSESRHNRNFGSSNRNNRFERVRAFSFNLDLDKQISEVTHLYYGAEVIANKVNSTASRLNISTETISPLSTRYPDDSDWQSLAGYLSMKLKLSNLWMFTVSGRLSHIVTKAAFTTEFYDFPFTEALLRNSALNGSLGLIFNPSKNYKFFTNLSSGFRAPNIDDIGKVFDSQPGNIIVPNPDLKPEKAYSLEIGMVGVVHKDLTFDVGLYYTFMNNAIARAPSTFNGQDSVDFDGTLSRVLSLQNISEMYVYGLQAGVDWKPGQHIQLTSSLNYQKGKEKDPATGFDFSPTHIAPLFGSTHFILNGKKFKTDVYANYNGMIAYRDLAFSERGDRHLYAKDEDGNPYAPSWWTLNVKTSVKTFNRLTLDAGIENIFDKRYRPYSSGISSPGRNFVLSLRFKV